MLDGVGVAGEDVERLAAVAEELLDGDGAEGHGLEARQVGARRLHPPVQPLQERVRRRLCKQNNRAVREVSAGGTLGGDGDGGEIGQMRYRGGWRGGRGRRRARGRSRRRG